MDIRELLGRTMNFSYELESARAISRQLDEIVNSSLSRTLIESYRREHADLLERFGPEMVYAAKALATTHTDLRHLVGGESISRFSDNKFVLEQVLGVGSIEDFSAPYLSMIRALGGSPVQGYLAGALSGLATGARFIGEFSYDAEDEEPADDLVESEEAGEASNVVTTTLMQVNWFPLVLFENLRKNPQLMRGLSDRQFEEFCAELLHQNEFEGVVLTPRSSDGGRDILAAKTISGIRILLAFECKRYKDTRKIGPDLFRALLGTVAHGPTQANKGVLLTTSSFTSGAKRFIATEPRVDGKDYNGLVEWVMKSKIPGVG